MSNGRARVIALAVLGTAGAAAAADTFLGQSCGANYPVDIEA